jgi:hypothetical protein
MTRSRPGSSPTVNVGTPGRWIRNLLTGRLHVVAPWPAGLRTGVLAGCGFLVGLALTRVGVNHADDIGGFTSTVQFQAWAVAIALQLGLWGLLAPGLWRIQRELWHRLPDASGRSSLVLVIGGYVGLLALIAAALRFVPHNPSIPSIFSLRTAILLWVGMVVVVPPIAIGMWLVQGVLGKLETTLRTAPRNRDTLELDWVMVGREVFGELLDLRGRLQQLLMLGGTIIGAATLATGALRLAVLAWKPNALFPPDYPVLYGGFFTVVLAFLYGPAYGSLQRQGRAIVDGCWPLPPAVKPDEAWYKARQTAESMLGLTISVRDGFQTGAAILAPLVTSLITVLLPTKSG